MTNPLFSSTFDNKYNAIPFNEIKTEHFEPAFVKALEEAKVNFKKLSEMKKAPTFENCIEIWESADEQLEIVAAAFYNMLGTVGDEDMHALSQKFGPMLSEFSNDIYLDSNLFTLVKTVYNNRNDENLNHEQIRLIEKKYKAFTRNGADLDSKGKEKIRKIDTELSSIGPKFSKNVLNATNAYTLHVSNFDDIKDIPKNFLDEAKQLASEEKSPEKAKGWIFTLQIPCFVAFMKYCTSSELRNNMWLAYAKRAYKDDFDNTQNIKDIVRLRRERAQLLGFKSHADYVLSERMAQKPESVLSFLKSIAIKAKVKAIDEMKELSDLKKEDTGEFKLLGSDVAFYMEKLNKIKNDIDEQKVSEYFETNKCVEGLFKHAQKLFGLNFKETVAPTYNNDVKSFEVTDKNSKFLGLLYMDLYPSKLKRPGAWMSPAKGQGKWNGTVERPHIHIVCNFPRPTEDTPSLLNFRNLTTLFHEFGHALHGLMSQCTYKSMAGTNVYWDFVELPSQIMENWVFEKETLKLFAQHYKTNEVIPDELITKLVNNRKFMSGYQTMRQLSFGLLDMSWHSLSGDEVVDDVEAFETDKTKDSQLLEKTPGTSMSCCFSHIFPGGYSAGYYSYMWAAVLDADAFEHFKNKGIYDPSTALSFETNILSKGNTMEPMDLYKLFRGKEPDPEALLRRQGLL